MTSISPTNAPPAPKPGRWRRRLTRLAFFCAVLATGIAGFYAVERYRGWTAWNAYQAEARARGVKLTFAEIIPKPVPDAENFASIPVFETLYRDFNTQGKITNPFKLPARKTGKIPSLSDPIKQVPIDLEAWRKYFLEVKLLDSPGENAAADVLEALDHFAAPLAELHEAGARPHCVFPVHWDQKWAATLPHLGLLLDAARLYAVRIAAHLALGQNAAALADFQDGLRLTTATREEPLLIEGMARISTSVLIINAVWAGLAEHQWTEPDLQVIEHELAALDWLADYRFGMSAERALENDVADFLASDPAKMVAAAPDGISSSPFVLGWLLHLFPSGWVELSKVRMNHFQDELAARIDPAKRRWFPDRPRPSAPTAIRSFSMKIRYLPFSVVGTYLEDVEKRWLLMATFTDQARIACALERYRLSRSSYPANLADLAPDFIPSVPLEIVNGQPYHYHLTQNGSFVLYSVGTDLHDDGGVIDPKLPVSKQRDWVWRYPAN